MYIPSLRSSGIPGLPSFISRSGFGYRQTLQGVLNNVRLSRQTGRENSEVGFDKDFVRIRPVNGPLRLSAFMSLNSQEATFVHRLNCMDSLMSGR